MKLRLLLFLILLLFANRANSAPDDLGTTSPTVQVSCTTSSALLAAANGARIQLDITLIGTGTVYVCRSPTCTTATAAFIFTNQGQSYREEHYNGPYSCITASGSATMAASETTA